MKNDSFSWSVQLQRGWLFAFLLGIPFSTFYLTEHPFAVSPINVFSVIFILLGIFNLVRGEIAWKLPKDKGLWWVLGGLFLVMAYALLFTHPLRSGIGTWVSRLTQPFLVGLFVEQMLANGKLKIIEIIRALFGSLVLLIVVGLFQRAGLIVTPSTGRITDLYQFPNTFARYVMILLLMGLPWLIQAYTEPGDDVLAKGNILHLYLLTWLLGGLLLLASVSYNGVVSCAVGVAVILAFVPGKAFVRFKVWTLTIMAAIAAFVAVNAPKLPKWQASITSSRLTRLQYWEVARGVIRDHAWTGIGLKGWELNYFHLAQHYIPIGEAMLLTTSEQPHNVFLDSLVKAGIPGLIAITALLIWPIWRGIQLVRQRKGAGLWFGLSFLSYGVALLLFGLIDDPLWSDDTIPLLFIFFFIAAWVWTEMKKTKRQFSD